MWSELNSYKCTLPLKLVFLISFNSVVQLRPLNYYFDLYNYKIYFHEMNLEIKWQKLQFCIWWWYTMQYKLNAMKYHILYNKKLSTHFHKHFFQQILRGRLLLVLLLEQKNNLCGKFKFVPIITNHLRFIMKILWMLHFFACYGYTKWTPSLFFSLLKFFNFVSQKKKNQFFFFIRSFQGYQIN